MFFDKTIKILGVSGSWLTAACIVVALYSMKQEHEWNRRLFTEQFGIESSRTIRELRPSLIKYFPENFNEGERSPLSRADAKKLFYACAKDKKENPFECEAKITAFEWLNFLESVSSVYWNNVGNQDSIMESYGGMVNYEYEYFKNLDLFLIDERGYPGWPPIIRFVEEYKEWKSTRGKPKSPTG